MAYCGSIPQDGLTSTRCSSSRNDGRRSARRVLVLEEPAMEKKQLRNGKRTDSETTAVSGLLQLTLDGPDVDLSVDRMGEEKPEFVSISLDAEAVDWVLLVEPDQAERLASDLLKASIKARDD